MAAVGGGGLCRLCGGSREAGEETRLHLSFHLRTPHGCKPSWEWALCAPSFRHHCLPLPAPTPLHTPPLVPRLQGIRRPSLPDSFGIKKNLAAHEVGAFCMAVCVLPRRRCSCAQPRCCCTAAQCSLAHPKLAAQIGSTFLDVTFFLPLYRLAPPLWPRCCTGSTSVSRRWSASAWCPAAGEQAPVACLSLGTSCACCWAPAAYLVHVVPFTCLAHQPRFQRWHKRQNRNAHLTPPSLLSCRPQRLVTHHLCARAGRGLRDPHARCAAVSAGVVVFRAAAVLL